MSVLGHTIDTDEQSVKERNEKGYIQNDIPLLESFRILQKKKGKMEINSKLGANPKDIGDFLQWLQGDKKPPLPPIARKILCLKRASVLSSIQSIGTPTLKRTGQQKLLEEIDDLLHSDGVEYTDDTKDCMAFPSAFESVSNVSETPKSISTGTNEPTEMVSTGKSTETETETGKGTSNCHTTVHCGENVALVELVREILGKIDAIGSPDLEKLYASMEIIQAKLKELPQSTSEGDVRTMLNEHSQQAKEFNKTLMDTLTPLMERLQSIQTASPKEVPKQLREVQNDYGDRLETIAHTIDSILGNTQYIRSKVDSIDTSIRNVLATMETLHSPNLDSLSERLESISQQLTSSSAQLQLLRPEEFHQRFEGLSNGIDTLSKRLEEVHEKKGTGDVQGLIESIHSEYTTFFEHLRGNIDDLLTRTGNIQSKVESIDDKVDSILEGKFRDAIDSRFDDLKRNISGIKANVSGGDTHLPLQQEVGRLQTLIERLQAVDKESPNTNSVSDALRLENESLRQSIAFHKGEMEMLTQTAESQEQEKTRLENEIQRLQQLLTRISQDIGSQSTRLVREEERSNDYAEKNRVLQEIVEELESRLAGMTSEKENVDGQVKARLEAAIQRMQQLLTRVSRDLELQSTRLAQEEYLSENLTKRNAMLQDMINELERRIAEMTSEKEELEKRIQESTREREEYDGNLTELQECVRENELDTEDETPTGKGLKIRVKKYQALVNLLKEKVREFAMLRTKLADAEGTLASVQAQLVTAEAKAGDAGKDCEETVQEAKRQSEVAQAQLAAAEARAETANKACEEALATANAKVSTAEEANATLQTQLREAEEAKSRLEEEHAQMEKDYSELESRYNELAERLRECEERSTDVVPSKEEASKQAFVVSLDRGITHSGGSEAAKKELRLAIHKDRFKKDSGWISTLLQSMIELLNFYFKESNTQEDIRVARETYNRVFQTYSKLFAPLQTISLEGKLLHTQPNLSEDGLKTYVRAMYEFLVLRRPTQYGGTRKLSKKIKSRRMSRRI